MARSFGGSGASRYNDKSKIFALAALALVIACVVAALMLISNNQKVEPSPKPVAVERNPEINMVEVLLPVRDIEAGTALEPALFKRNIRPSLGLSEKTLHDFEEIKGLFARSLIVANQPITRDYVTNRPPVSGVSAKIPEGYRAVTIKVDVRTAVEGFVKPGSKVDVSWISSVNGKPTLTLIVQNAQVLSVERSERSESTSASASPPSTATLLVTAQDAQKIQLASMEGSLSLSLRGDSDSGKTVDGGEININDVLQPGVKDGRPTQECSGTVTMGGQKFCVKSGGRLEPLSE